MTRISSGIITKFSDYEFDNPWVGVNPQSLKSYHTARHLFPERITFTSSEPFPIDNNKFKVIQPVGAIQHHAAQGSVMRLIPATNIAPAYGIELLF
ncbi:unnamed protein product [Allacma fusca]|uniref:Uncharacterized protein n=1 Tax=Allacma fusca TaxID=39272 RepID=A0A8J2J6A2_9HEXA|nr:unnamed protein product [Allacma fusca]